MWPGESHKEFSGVDAARLGGFLFGPLFCGGPDVVDLVGLPDPRSGNARRHKLLDVLTIALTALICGARSCADFPDFAHDREALFRDFLELPRGLPSHGIFSRLFRLLDPAAFATCFTSFLSDLGQDGTGQRWNLGCRD